MVAAAASSARARSAGRFVVAGLLNTGVTALLLSVLSLWIDQRVAYSIVFALGIVLSTFLAGTFVFRSRLTLVRSTAYVLLYLGVYVVGLAVTNLMVRAGLPPLAAGAVVVVTAPLGFVAGSVVFRAIPDTRGVEPVGSEHASWVARGLHDRYALLHVLGLLIILEAVVFWSYFAGTGTPQWDFLASYQTEAFAWWNRGGIVNPPEWMSYAWMGFPADSNLQNSSYYLPVGLANAISLYTPHVAAILAALQVAFCALGTYLLARRMTLSHWAAMVALVAGFFSAGLFANAQHVDIARGIAWLPWLALVVSPLWYWRRWWSIPVAGMVVWQFLVGAYPGQIVAALYCLPLWTGVWLIVSRPAWRWMINVITSATCGLLLAMAKFGPALMLGAGHVNAGPQSVTLSARMAATIFFSYDDPALPNDISMRTYFLVSPIVVLFLFAKFSTRRNWPALALGVPALICTLATQWGDGVVSLLPGMSISRFRSVDFKPFLLLSVVLIGSAGAQWIISKGSKGSRRRLWWPVFVVIGAVAGAFSVTHDSPGRQLAVAFVLILVGVAAALTWAAARGERRARRRGLMVGLVGTSVLSGLAFAYTVQPTWVADLHEQELINYGAPVASLVAQNGCDATVLRRQTRFVPTVSPGEYFRDVSALVGAFDCAEGVGGYINVKGNAVRVLQNDSLIADSTGDLIRFYGAPGAVVPLTDKNTLGDLSDNCLKRGACNGLVVKPNSYSQAGTISYELDASNEILVALNESYYPGWEAQICTVAKGCHRTTPAAGPAGSLMLNVPAGPARLWLEYHPPGRASWFMMAGLGAMILAFSPLMRLRRAKAGSARSLPSPRRAVRDLDDAAT